MTIAIVLGIAQPAIADSLAPEAQAAARLESTWRAHGSPAMSAAIAFNGRIVFSEGRGFADLDNMVPASGSTVYNIGSVSKANTAVAVMQLLEQGRIRLDDPIQKYVPSFPGKGEAVTLHHLMSHTSGIRHYRATDFPDSGDNENVRAVSSLEEGIKVFKDDPLLLKPGAFYFYSSYAVNLLQGVVEQAGGMPFEDYMRKCVWGPSGMLSTAFDIPERIVPHRAKSYRVEKGRTLNGYYGDLTYKFASGGMISTVEDLVRLGTALNHGQLLKPETVAQMYRAHKRLSPHDASELLKVSFGGAEAVALSASEYWRTVDECRSGGRAGGRVYDALIAACAVKGRAKLLLTWNVSDFELLAVEGLEIRSPASV